MNCFCVWIFHESFGLMKYPYTKTINLHLQTRIHHELVLVILCRTMACFEWNLHTQISGGDSVLSTTFCGITLWIIHFCFMTHYDITIAKHVAKDVHCDIITGHDVVMGTYHDVTMQTDVAMMLTYLLLHPIMIFKFSC